MVILVVAHGATCSIYSPYHHRYGDPVPLWHPCICLQSINQMSIAPIFPVVARLSVTTARSVSKYEVVTAIP